LLILLIPFDGAVHFNGDLLDSLPGRSPFFFEGRKMNILDGQRGQENRTSIG